MLPASIKSNNNKKVAALALAALFVVYSVTVTAVLGTACPFALLTGLPCPACGMTRACLAALDLELATAFYFHPLFFTVPMIAAMLAIMAARPETSKSLPLKAFCAITSAAFIGVYVYRMFATYPAEPLAYNYNSLAGLLRRLIIS